MKKGKAGRATALGLAGLVGAGALSNSSGCGVIWYNVGKHHGEEEAIRELNAAANNSGTARPLWNGTPLQSYDDIGARWPLIGTYKWDGTRGKFDVYNEGIQFIGHDGRTFVSIPFSNIWRVDSEEYLQLLAPNASKLTIHHDCGNPNVFKFNSFGTTTAEELEKYIESKSNAR